ncbi:adenylate/guanylate cyclase domain-containing protein [Azospirillum sp. TSO22-1]|uniref:adenylate/guanylate cyclase domain-containing protein n=1 Tax=Azospirillum sp. TSO22-1 TaxID=716789 RepID=UPI000D645E10|nr:adenylate/guanylate cyclase domain-containing protein [Azospirillum sp. TSO22-1]
MADSADSPVTSARPRRRLRLPIAAVLVAGFGSLMLAAVASVLVLGLVSAGRNTFALLADKADLALAGVEVRVRHQLDPAAAMAKFVARLIERGELDPADTSRLADTLRGALAGAPDVTGAAFIAADLTGVRAGRQDGALTVHGLNLQGAPDVPAEVFSGADRSTPQWAEPLWNKESRTSFISLFHPVRKDGRYLGQVAVGVSLGDLSRFLSNLYVEQGVNAFVLYDGEHVLAHPSLAVLKFDFSAKTDGPPLPRLDQLQDPALSALRTRGQPAGAMKNRAEGRMVRVGGEDMLFLTRAMTGYGRQEWTVGIAVPAAQMGGEVERLYKTGIIGLGILLVSVAVALLVGRRISRQVGRLAEAADRVRAFDFRNVQDLPDSRLQELSRAANAFNAMVAGLQWFETYVPKALVLRLMHRRDTTAAGLTSEERVVTVLFTDIRGFSRLAEHLGAADTAALLNDHFTQVAACIEAEDGTVDKFIGDSIMAFWGAPDEQADHAARALRAAHAIARAIRADNRERAARGQPPIRVSIGLHSGPVVVGNIGSASRINYTIVGDTVNVTARVEELASRVQGEDEISVLASAATARAGAGAAPLESLGPHRLRGRAGTMEVWRLTLPAEEPALG